MATPDDQNIEDIVFGSESADGQPNLEILMEQYKLFVETPVRRSERFWRLSCAVGSIELCRRWQALSWTAASQYCIAD